MFLFSFALDLPLQYFFFLFSPRLLDVEGRVEGGRQRLRAAGGEQGQEAWTDSDVESLVSLHQIKPQRQNFR